MSDATIEKLISLTKITESAGFHEDSKKFVEEIVKTKQETITIEERNLFVSVFKKWYEKRMRVWLEWVEIEKIENARDSKYLNIIIGYKANYERWVKDLCMLMLNLIDNYLLKKDSATELSDEYIVFFTALKAEYNKNMYLISVDEEKKRESYKKASYDFYNEAYTLSNKLECVNSVKLGVALQYALFQREILNNITEAISIADENYELTMQQWDKVDDDKYKDASPILFLLKSNRSLWNAQLVEGKEESSLLD